MLTLVLLPGMDGTGKLFGPLISALGDDVGIRVVRYPANESLGYEALETFTRSSLPAEGDFVVLAESFSGPIALSLAAARPPRLVGLVLCNTFARNPRPELSALRAFVPLLPVKLAPLLLLGHLLLGPYSTPILRSMLSSALAQVSAATLRARIKAILTVDVLPKLGAIQVPVLYLLAEHDQVVPPIAAKTILEAIPHAQRVLVEAPHLLLQAAPTIAASAVSAFLRHILDLRHSRIAGSG